MNEFQKSESQIEKGIIVLQNTAEKTLNELIRKAENEKMDDVVNGVEKAKKSFENGEFGKTIYIAQNLINYLKGKNPLTGLSTIPAEGIPLIGIVFVGVTWYGYRKWKEKNKPEIVQQSIPRNGENATRPIAPRDSDE